MIEIHVPLPDWPDYIRKQKNKRGLHKYHMTAPLSPNVKMHHMTAYKRNERLKGNIKVAFFMTPSHHQAREILNSIQDSHNETCKLLIKINYVHPRMFDSNDNLGSSLKGAIDCIADILIPGLQPGRADGDKRLAWKLSQSKGKPHEHALIINIYPSPQPVFGPYDKVLLAEPKNPTEMFYGIKQEDCVGKEVRFLRYAKLATEKDEDV